MESTYTCASVRSGVKLLHMPVAITIIVVLAALIFAGARRGIESASKSRAVSERM